MSDFNECPIELCDHDDPIELCDYDDDDDICLRIPEHLHWAPRDSTSSSTAPSSTRSRSSSTAPSSTRSRTPDHDPDEEDELLRAIAISKAEHAAEDVRRRQEKLDLDMAILMSKGPYTVQTIVYEPDPWALPVRPAPARSAKAPAPARSAQTNYQDDCCPICLDDFNGDPSFNTRCPNCLKAFHKTCMESSFMGKRGRSRLCACCRASVGQDFDVYDDARDKKRCKRAQSSRRS
jgi:hypothetical protein